MNLLFVTPQLPWPPTQGTALRNHHLLAAAAAAHQVDLLSFDARPGGRSGPPPQLLAQLCRRIVTVPAPHRAPTRRLADAALGHADMEGRLWSPVFRRRLDELLASGSYDAVQLEGFEVAGYLLGPAALRREAAGRTSWQRAGSRPPALIFDDHNAEYRLQQSAAAIDARTPTRWARAAYSALQARHLRRREALYCAAADRTMAVSVDDAAALEAIVPGLGVAVVPNGIDVAAFPPPAPAPVPTLFFAGKLDYRPNVDACCWLVGDILSLVRRAVPDVRVVLAGRDPAPAVAALAGGAVRVTGALDSETLLRLQAQAWVYVVPMRMGSGVRFKAMEAMAARIPLVATPLGASGTGAVDGEHALIAGDAAAFARAVVSLLRDAEERRRLARNARALAEARHDWRQITPRLLAVYDELARPLHRPVSLIATVRDERSGLAPWLASIAGQRRPPEEMVVVDGGSRDGTYEALLSQQVLPLRALREPGAGISRGRNAAVAAAGHDVIAVTDAGVALDSDWLARLAAPLERDTTLPAASGFFVAAPRSTWERALGATTLPGVDEVDPGSFLPSSRSVAVTRAAWRAAGGYPEWLDYSEDLVFDSALLRHGDRPRFVPRAVVHFRPRATPGAFFVQYYRYARGDGKADLWRRRHAVRYATYLCAAAAVWHAIRSPAHRVPAGAALLAGGIAYTRRPFIRLAQQSESSLAALSAAPLVPLVRFIGDAAKMCGYPVGIWWRLRHLRQVQGTR